MRGLRDDGRVTEEEVRKVVAKGGRDRPFRSEEVSKSGNSDREVLAAHDAETELPQSPEKLGKQVNRVRYDRYVTSLDGLPTHARPLEEVGPFGESETRGCAKARQRSQSGPGAAGRLQAWPVDAARVIPAQEFLYAGGDI